MAYTQTDVDRMKANLAKGLTRAKVGDEEVQFASMAEMRRQLNIMVSEVSGAKSGGMSVSYPRTTRGL
tara:strand:- start:11444 stop:11647 length:204 start_codon:yes stop_codon:yes gene_type:complete